MHCSVHTRSPCNNTTHVHASIHSHTHTHSTHTLIHSLTYPRYKNALPTADLTEGENTMSEWRTETVVA